MGAPPDYPAHDVTDLRDCVDNLFGIMAIAAERTSDAPVDFLGTLLDALLRMLRLAFVCVRFEDPERGQPLEILRVAESVEATTAGDLSIASARLGPHGEFGVIAAGSFRPDFPQH